MAQRKVVFAVVKVKIEHTFDMGNDSPLLQVSGVTKRFAAPGNSAPPILVLEKVSLEVRIGDSVAVVGPSGSGKSTLLHLIGTLDRPDEGRVLLDGEDLATLDENHLAMVRNEKIGFVFQAHYLLPQCTVMENVLVPTLARRRKQEAAGVEARAQGLLRRLGLGERLAHRPGQLSGGERQRVAVARALINRPRLLLADEPTGSLDQGSALELAGLLRELNQEEKVALILVTHSSELAAMAHRIYRLTNGHLGSTTNGNQNPPPRA